GGFRVTPERPSEICATHERLETTQSMSIGRSGYTTGILLIAGIALGSTGGDAQMRCPADSRTDHLATRFVISAGTVKMPVGALLLVRKNGQIGAIRLISINPTASEWLGKSTYESFFQPDSSGSLVANNVVGRTRELDIRPTKGVHAVYLYSGGHRD